MENSLKGRGLKRSLLLAVAYVLLAIVPATCTVTCTQKSLRAMKQAYDLDNIRNVGALQVRPILDLIYENLVSEHPIASGFITRPVLSGVATYLRQNLDLPPANEANQELEQIPGLIQQARSAGQEANRWSLALWILSGVYFGAALLLNRGRGYAPFIFALTVLSLICFGVGISAQAIVISIMSPKLNLLPSFVLQVDTRSILGVIANLFNSGHWGVGCFLTLFSIVIPITKAVLILYALVAASPSDLLQIRQFLRVIGKWSMADVFVAAILLAFFAVRAQSGSQAVLIRGFYYFLAYCILSLVAGTLLEWHFDHLNKAQRTATSPPA